MHSTTTRLAVSSPAAGAGAAGRRAPSSRPAGVVCKPPPAPAPAPPARARGPPPPAARNPFAALFSGGRGGGKASRPSPATAAAVEELLTLARTTRAGVATPAPTADRIADLAATLRRSRPPRPTSSPLFWGRYAVAYCSNPAAPGGPVLTSAPGRAVLAGQRPVQTLEPGKLTNSVSYKALGFLPGTASQTGGLAVTGPATYRVAFKEATRDFEVLYLDERVRVAEFQPGEGREPQLFVFERLGLSNTNEGSEDEEEGANEEAAAAAAPKRPIFSLASFLVKPQESLAAAAEREAGAKDTAAAGARAPAPPAPRRPQPAAAAAPASSTAADPVAASVASFASDASVASAEAKEAAAAARAAAAAATPLLRSTAGARAAVGRAEVAAAAAEEEAAEAAAALSAAEAELKRAAAALGFLQKQRV